MAMTLTQAENSGKRLAIIKANAQMVIVMSVASFLTIFALFATKAVWAGNAYRAKVISAKEQAHHQLLNNITAANNLAGSYQKFVNTDKNVLGGPATTPSGAADDNGVIVLDALPSSYDFPALTSSIEKIINDQRIPLSSVSGTDDQVNQQSTNSAPAPVNMPFSFTVGNVNYTDTQTVLTTLEASIRPIQIDTLNISGSSNNLQVSVNAHTYYQPGLTLTIDKKAVQ